jgi:rhodanese-related sulfurtransferase
MIKITSRFVFLAILFAIGFFGLSGAYLWSAAQTKYKTISAEQFAQMMDKKDFLLVNVHIPYEGEIAQTDLLIPFNQIDRYQDLLPEDKNSKIVVYCLMGPMGSIAADKLARMGYTQVFNLQGGMIAWQNLGKEVFNRYPERRSSLF